MRRQKRELEIFNLSFLDVISCGFGAVVLLVLISNYAETDNPAEVSSSISVLNEVLAAEREVEELREVALRGAADLESKKTLLEKLKQALQSQQATKDSLATELSKLEKSAAGLLVVKSSLERAAISQSSTDERDEEVGGIPVDSDYVIFIVDTSGSMKEIWSKVTAQVVNIIRVHPKIRGFQIMNDNGAHLIEGYKGRWIPDTPKMRESVISVFEKWNSTSNSSPVEGLEAALRLYAKPDSKVSIYIFGDEYSGSSYDPVINALSSLNTNRVTGEKLARVHAIGFLSNYSTSRFSTLMRAVTERNNGTFVALPR